MELLTKAIRNSLPPLYAQDGKGGDATVYIKYFCPDFSWTWYVLEGSPVLNENGVEIDFEFFGLVDGFEKELGYFRLSDLKSFRGKLGLPIERDLYFSPKPLKEIVPGLLD